MITFATTRAILKRSGVSAALFYILEKIFSRKIYSHIKRIYPKFYLKTKLKNLDFYLLVDPCDDGISRDLFLYGEREEHAARCFMKYLKPGQIIVDIGSNIGYYVLFEAYFIRRTGRIFAIEPDLNNVNLLKRNVKLNSLESIVDITHAAISNYSGNIKLHIANMSNLHAINVLPSMKKYVHFKDIVEVPCYTLEDFCSLKKISFESVDVLRMDVEGHETYILSSSIDLLKNNKKLVLFIEIHPRLIKEDNFISYYDFLKLFEDLNFKVAGAFLSQTSKIDYPLNVSSVMDLLDYDDAIELILYKT